MAVSAARTRPMRRPRNWRGAAVRVASIVLVLGAWQIYGDNPVHFATPPPTKVFPALWTAITDGKVLHATLGTLATVAVGLVISIVIGLIVGFAVALFPWARNTLDPLIDAAYAMPVTMLIPVVGVYTGLGFRGRVFIVITYVALVIVISTSTGVRDAPRDLLETGRSFGLRGMRLWRQVVFPSALSHIASGISTGVARAVRGAVTAELLLIAADLGAVILNASATLDTSLLLGGIVWTLLLGYVLYTAALALERRLLRWRTFGEGG